MSRGFTYYLYPGPGFYSVAIFTAIGDNFTAMFTYYYKAAVINPTSDPLLTTLGGDLDCSRLLTYYSWILSSLTSVCFLVVLRVLVIAILCLSMHPWSRYISFFSECLYKLRHGDKARKKIPEKNFFGVFFWIREPTHSLTPAIPRHRGIPPLN